MEKPSSGKTKTSSKVVNLSDLLPPPKELFITGIPSLDQLFKENAISSGEIYELIGLSGTGKTMLLNTIMINLLGYSQNIEIIFIDTKLDFHSLKLVNMMKARNIPEQLHAKILSLIKLYHCKNADELILTLKDILKQRDENKKVKIIMIDSITVPFYLYLGQTFLNHNRMKEVQKLLKELIKIYNVAVSKVTSIILIVDNVSIIPPDNLHKSRIQLDHYSRKTF